MTKNFLESAHFGPFGSNPLLQMAHINYPDSHHSQILRFATQISPLLNLLVIFQP